MSVRGVADVFDITFYLFFIFMFAFYIDLLYEKISVSPKMQSPGLALKPIYQHVDLSACRFINM